MKIEISCKSNDGSIKHYYHFFYACLIPLIHFHIYNPLTFIYFNSNIGEMKSLIETLPFSSQIIFNNISYNNNENISKILLNSYDIYDSKYYNLIEKEGSHNNNNNNNNNKIQDQDQYQYEKNIKKKLNKINETMRQEIINYFDKYIRINKKEENSNILITLIERDQIPQTSHSSKLNSPTINSTSGYLRRHIRNHNELKQALSKHYGKLFQNIYLERLSLAEQFELFQSTSILIAQHGASLSNIFFMSPKCSSNNKLSHIIEISPPYSRKSKYFYNLANSFHISYSSIYQHKNKGNISIPEVIQHINCILINWKQYLHQNIECSHQNLGKICGNIVEQF